MEYQTRVSCISGEHYTARPSRHLTSPSSFSIIQKNNIQRILETFFADSQKQMSEKRKLIS